MTQRPAPLLFAPHLLEKPWGGQRLANLFPAKFAGKSQTIGESWELSGLAERVSVVRGGPLAGRTLADVVTSWGRELLGNASLTPDGDFPLLIKFLDAAQPLSVQVHPIDGNAEPHAAPKSEAWYVVDAAPGACLWIGLRDGVTLADCTAAAGTAELVSLLRRWPARPGSLFYLPTGIPHALGANIVVAEVQTPSDVTYRLYDWDRTDSAGRPRALHIEQGLGNLLVDVRPEEISPPREHSADAFATVSRLLSTRHFRIDKVRLAGGAVQTLPHAEMVIWIVLRGQAELSERHAVLSLGPGDVALIPAACTGARVQVASEPIELLEVTIPVASPLAEFPHPPPEPRQTPQPGGLVRLQRTSSPPEGPMDG